MDKHYATRGYGGLGNFLAREKAENRLAGVYFSAGSALELPAGTVEKADARIVDRIVLA